MVHNGLLKFKMAVTAILGLCLIVAFVILDEKSYTARYLDGRRSLKAVHKQLSSTHKRHHRQLQSIEHYNDPLNTTDLQQATPCKGVLITSSGGVGSSDYLEMLNDILSKNNQDILTNDYQDGEGFKHRPATWWHDMHYHDATSIIGRFQNHVYCFSKALVIIGDPIHAIESTNRRFGGKHINKLKYFSGLGMYNEEISLQEIYEDIAASGEDTTGIANYIQSWYYASQDRSHWPEIKMVTTPVLYNNAVDIARWIGVDDPTDLDNFSGFHFDTSIRETAYKAKYISDSLRKQIEAIFEPLNAIVDRIEGGETNIK